MCIGFFLFFYEMNTLTVLITLCPYYLISKRIQKRSKQLDKSSVTKQQVKGMILSLKQEMPIKYILGSFSGSVSNTAIVTPIAMPGYGTGSQNRVGDDIEIDHIDLRYFWYRGDPTYNVCRFTILQMKGDHGVPLAGELFAGGVYAPVDVTSVLYPYAPGREFLTIMDETFILQVNSDKSERFFSKKIIPKIKRTPFTPGTYNPFNGLLVFVFMSDSGAIPHPTLDLVSNVWFRDV